MNWKIEVVLGVLIVALLAVLGCVYGPKRVTYNALAGTEIGADEAMQLWGEYVKEFHPPADQEQTVKDAYEKYQAAELEAIDAAQLIIIATSAGNTNGIADAQSKQSAANTQAAAALADLLGLLRKFGVKL